MPAEQSAFPSDPRAAVGVLASLLQTLHADWVELNDQAGTLDSRRESLDLIVRDALHAYGHRSPNLSCAAGAMLGSAA